MGKSRSTTFVVAYLMKIKRLGLNYALDHVRKCRKIASPNSNFIKQLKEYEYFLKIKKII
jgi:atypical dual specificity phosphatase